MATTPIKIPDLPSGITLTIDVLNTVSLATLETVTMSYSSGVYSGNVTGAHSGQFLFRLLASGTIIGSRLRTILDTTDTFVIIEAMESLGVTVGANLVTVTIDDGTDPVENASVRLTSGAISEVRLTDVSGEAEFSLNDATYAVTITCPGFGGEVDSLVVSGTTSDTFSLTATSVTPPATALLSTGTLRVYDEFNVVEADVPITVQYVSGPGDDGYAMDTKPWTEISDVSGDVEFVGLRRGSLYKIWRGVAASTPSTLFSGVGSGEFTVPNADSFLLPEIKGLDEEVAP